LLVRQGDPGDELFLLLDGVLIVDVDGEPVAELGPGAVLGGRRPRVRSRTRPRKPPITLDPADLDRGALDARRGTDGKTTGPGPTRSAMATRGRTGDARAPARVDGRGR
jgi:hypothetical protein